MIVSSGATVFCVADETVELLNEAIKKIMLKYRLISFAVVYFRLKAGATV